MKKLLSLFFVLGLTLSACGTSPTQSAPPAQTSTPSLVPTATQTPIPPTSTIAPTKNQICPNLQEKAEITLSAFYSTQEYYPDLIEALNRGASIQKIAEVFQEELTAYYSSSYTLFYEIVDIANDGVSEIFLKNDHRAMFLGCKNGIYEILYFAEYSDYLVVQIEDTNQNKVPDILIGDFHCTSFDCKYDLSILEYKDNKFRTILEGVSAYSATWVKIEDFDGDGVTEIFWRGGISAGIVDKTLREETHIYKWNGHEYVAQPVIYAPPIFLFQSIQDADQEVINNNYPQALILYKNTIQNKSLDWWSLERALYEKQINQFTDNPSAIQVPPSPDPSEYPRLASYAYYRIMLLHLAQGQEAEAASTYQTLQETFGNDPYAAPYVEMASAFWESYQSTKKMYDGCAAAIQYAVEHPEILTPLGSDYHGWQSHIYEPADVCPFR